MVRPQRARAWRHMPKLHQDASNAAAQLSPACKRRRLALSTPVRIQRQALTAQFNDLLYDGLLLGYLNQRTVFSDLPTEWRGPTEKAPALLLIGLGPQHPLTGGRRRRRRCSAPARQSNLGLSLSRCDRSPGSVRAAGRCVSHPGLRAMARA